MELFVPRDEYGKEDPYGTTTTVSPLFTDNRYNDKVRVNDDLTGTKSSLKWSH